MISIEKHHLNYSICAKTWNDCFLISNNTTFYMHFNCYIESIRSITHMWIHNICRVFANIVRYIYLETNDATFFQLCRYILLFLLNILFIFHPVHQKKVTNSHKTGICCSFVDFKKKNLLWRIVNHLISILLLFSGWRHHQFECTHGRCKALSDFSCRAWIGGFFHKILEFF